jgi:ubiquitin-large subunit ribosomal protein L40e
VGGVVRHSQRTARDPEGLKNARRLAAMTAMRGLGFEPDMGLWASPGFEPRAVPLEGMRGEGSIFVDARAAAGGGGAERAPAAGAGAPGAAGAEAKRGRPGAAAARGAAPFSVYVKTLTGKTTVIDVAAAGAVTALDLKRAYEAREGVPVDAQRLIFAGWQLKDGGLLSDYGIAHEDTVHCVLRPRGC